MRDGHVHSPYCPHGSNDSFDMYIEKAIEVGIDEITFTEHFPLPIGFKDPSPYEDSAMTLKDIDKYILDLNKIKDKYKGKIKINIGFEVDYLEGYEEEIRNLLNKYGDIIEDAILSVHMVKIDNKFYCIDFDSEKFGELVNLLGGVSKVYDLYYKTLIKAINADLGEFKPKRIGHLNLVRKYNKKFPYDYIGNKYLKEIIKLIKENNFELDYNISGLYKEDCKEPYLYGYLLDLVKQYNIPTVIGSDSHNSNTIDNYELKLNI